MAMRSTTLVPVCAPGAGERIRMCSRTAGRTGFDAATFVTWGALGVVVAAGVLVAPEPPPQPAKAKPARSPQNPAPCRPVKCVDLMAEKTPAASSSFPSLRRGSRPRLARPVMPEHHQKIAMMTSRPTAITTKAVPRQASRSTSISPVPRLAARGSGTEIEAIETTSRADRSSFGQHFGLTERVHDDEHLTILGSRDGSLVALSEGPVPERLRDTNHFGFQLENGDQVRWARERLREAGVAETEWQDSHGFVRVQVSDPDGYRVELFATGFSSPVGGFAGSKAVLIGARLLQGVGAATMLPAALSILTTSFTEGKDRLTAIGVWGGVGGLASAAGVLLGGLLTDGPSWRWVMFVNPIASVLVLGGIFRLIDSGERRRAQLKNFDLLGAILVTSGMLLLVYALVKASSIGWSNARTLGEIAVALALLVAFVINELRHRNPLAPLSIFRINGLGFSNLTQLIAIAGFGTMFFFLTIYMQNVLHYSPLQAGLAYLPLCFAIGISAGIASQLLSRLGTRPVIVAGALVSAAGMYWLSRIPVHGTFLHDLLPGMLVLSFGFGPVFVAITTAANAGVPADKAGLAASLLNASQQLGGALGLAIFTALATSHTHSLLAAHSPPAQALTAGDGAALLLGSVFLAAAAVIALKATNTHGEAQADQPLPDVVPSKPVMPKPLPA
jgi:EmrB/QacA subfamily drug resistance transporter